VKCCVNMIGFLAFDFDFFGLKRSIQGRFITACAAMTRGMQSKETREEEPFAIDWRAR
jgi:hypothetical protein